MEYLGQQISENLEKENMAVNTRKEENRLKELQERKEAWNLQIFDSVAVS